MLILSRNVNQSIKINHEIEVVVVEIRRGKVRLGFRAPPDVIINRAEVDDQPDRAERRQ